MEYICLFESFIDALLTRRVSAYTFFRSLNCILYCTYLYYVLKVISSVNCSIA